MNIQWFLYLKFLMGFLRLSWESTYNVAVVEYGPNISSFLTPNETLEINTKNYIKIIKETVEINNKSLDLIIFPESTLMYPNKVFETAAQLPPMNDIVLCNSTNGNYAQFLKELSCAAIEHKITIIINFIEQEICERNDNQCEGSIFYNTNAALGSNGTIIARYRKWNLFGEYGKSKPKKLDLPVIRIKDSTFGMMTCFDIQFLEPAFNLTRNMGIKNIIFPLNWISELPYLTALQVQQMWAQEFNVVLLAAGSSIPGKGAGGSGIFLGNQGSLDSFILPKHGTKVTFQNVPVNILEQNYTDILSNDDSVEFTDSLALEMDDFFILVDPTIIEHNSIVLNDTQKNINLRICHGDNKNHLCCYFNISITVDQNITGSRDHYYVYHLVAFNGVRSYSELYYGGVETCGLIACLNRSLASCGQRFQNYSSVKWPITFNSISVTGSFKQSDRRIQYASTLRSSIRPLPLQNIEWTKDILNSTVTRKLSLKHPENRLLSFGIFGRDTSRDHDPIRESSASCSNNSAAIFLLLVLSLHLCFI